MKETEEQGQEDRRLYKDKESYQTAYNDIETWNTSTENKDAMRHFLKLIVSDCDLKRRLKYIRHMKQITVWLAKDYKDAVKDDMVDLLNVLDTAKSNRGTEYSPETIKDFKVCIKKFWKTMYGEGETMPKTVSWIKGKTGKHKQRKKVVLSFEEVEKMVDAAQTIRDKAIVSMLFESCCRPSEFLSLTIGDLKKDEFGYTFQVEGKTGVHQKFCYQCKSYITEWLRSHPSKDDKDSPLFICLDWYRHGQMLTLRGLNKKVKELCKKAGIDKNINSYCFRRSGITYKRGHLRMSDGNLESFCGWTAGSKQLKVYSKLTGFEAKAEIAEKMGLVKGKSNEPKQMGYEEPLTLRKELIDRRVQDELLNRLMQDPAVIEKFKKIILDDPAKT